MGKKAYFVATVMIFIFSAAKTSGLPEIDGKVLGLYPINNEISFYRNVDDSGNDRGQTLQVISINGFKIWTEFVFEFTGDFNWDMAYDLDMSKINSDHYIELSLVKPLFNWVSLNYQRIHSSFEDEPINQFGVRFSF